MPQIGPLEILVVAVLALLVFGPEKLPEIGRTLGKGLNQMKKMASDVKSEFDLSMDDEDDKPEASASKAAEPAPAVMDVAAPVDETPRAAAGV